MELLSLREKAVLETYTFPSHTSTFISSLFPHEESLSQLKEKKMQKEYAEERLKCRGKWAGLRFPFRVLHFSVSHRQKHLDGFNSSFEYRNEVHTGQLWHIILCDFIICLLPRCSYTTSEEGEVGQTGFIVERQSRLLTWSRWKIWALPVVRHLSGFSSCFSDFGKEVHLCTGSFTALCFPGVTWLFSRL